MSFYVTLPSDSSLNYFPKNTVSKFRTYLPQILELEGNFEVGLAEMSYPRTWNNVKEDQILKVYTCCPLSDLILKTNTFPEDKYITQEVLTKFPQLNTIPFSRILYKTVTLPRGNYATPEILISHLNKILVEYADFGYSVISKKVKAVVTENMVVEIPPQLAIILGFTLEHVSVLIEESVRAPFTVDMDASLHSLFIYSDVVEKTIVGDNSVPLLRIISAKGGDGETVDCVFTRPHYQPVSSSNIQMIEINIMDDLGDPIQFERGKAHVTLHFRPRKTWAPL